MKVDHILIPVDFSPSSNAAVNSGIAMARRFRARVTLLHVVEMHLAYESAFPADSLALKREMAEQAHRLLSALVSPEDQDDLSVQTIVKIGSIEHEIFETIREQRPDVVVMGTHGRGLFGRFLIGSVAQDMLRRSPVPVLTVCRALQPLVFGRVLFATDFSDSSKLAFATALDIAEKLQAQLVLFHAIDPATVKCGESEMAVPVADEVLKAAQGQLKSMEAEAARHHVRVERIICEGNAAEQILNAAAQGAVDLIMLAVAPKGLLERAIIGSTAERVIREARLPVLSLPIGRTVLVGRLG